MMVLRSDYKVEIRLKMYRALLILIIVLTSILLISGDWAHGLSQDQETKSELQQGPEPIENSSEPPAMTSYNISTLTRAAAFVILVGFGQTIVLLTGGIDLSVASIASICGMFSAIFMVRLGLNPYLSIILACLLGLVFGAINGFFISYFKLTPFIVTLATMEIYKGIVYVITKGMPITGMPKSAQQFANGVIGGILPNVVIIMVVICILLTILLNKTKTGRYITHWEATETVQE